jgi:putative molybdopterin biosynthesis protein
MYSIQLQASWQVSGDTMDSTLFALLEAMREKGSLRSAAQATSLSYRHVWGLLRKWEALLGQPLAILERGRGASLSPLGEALLQARRQLDEQLAPALIQAASGIERQLASAASPKRRRLLIHASHDLALAQLRALPAGRDKLEFELQFHGSLENLTALAHGQCDLAGFHVAEQARSAEIARLLRADAHKLIGVAIREQGLMVAHGNPKAIHGLRDLTRRGLRFVNRQQGSGTRLAFDQLLDSAGIARQQVRYQGEESTHIAVAAAIAGGAADTGFGILAAAAQYGLGFIPLLSERYLLACRAERLKDSDMQALLQTLRGARFRAILADLPGYDRAITGKVMGVADGLSGPRPAGARN